MPVVFANCRSEAVAGDGPATDGLIDSSFAARKPGATPKTRGRYFFV